MNSGLGLNTLVFKVTQRDAITLHKGVVDLEEVEQRDLVQFICHLFIQRINIGRNRKTITEGDSLEASTASRVPQLTCIWTGASGLGKLNIRRSLPC